MSYLSANLQKVGPSWLLDTLAGLYWRAHGKVSNGIDCFRRALSTAPDRYAHIPLTNMAALLLKMDSIADALALAESAHRTHRSQADTNFLLGLLYLLTGNYSAAAIHLQRTVNSRPDYADAGHYRLVASCLAAGEGLGQKGQCQEVQTATFDSDSID